MMVEKAGVELKGDVHLLCQQFRGEGEFGNIKWMGSKFNSKLYG